MRIFKKKNGYWYAEIGRGQAYSLKTKNKSLAQEMFKQIQKEQILGRFIQPKKEILLSDFINEYNASRIGRVADNTINIDREAFKKLIAFMGDPDLAKITTQKCESFVSHLLKILNPTTTNMYIRHIRTMFNKSVEWEYLDKSPFTVKQIKIKDTMPRALSKADIDRLLQSISSQEFKELVLTSLYTGGRRESVCKLEWQNFKLYGEVWTVKFTHTKNDNLVIPVSTKLQEILFYRKQNQGAVFPTYHENVKAASKDFRKYADLAGLKEAKLHDIRHTTGTWMIISGVPQRKVQGFLGHSSIKTTEIYTKIALEHLIGIENEL